MKKSRPQDPDAAVTADMQTVLELRASRLRAPLVASEEDDAPFWIAEFPVGDELYGLPLESLRACLPLKMVTPVPLSSPKVIGILRFQGEILTTFSLAAMLEGKGWRTDPSVILVVERGGGQLMALDCEQIPRPLAIPATAVERAWATGRGSVAEIATPKNQRFVHLIDLARLFKTEGEDLDGG